MKLLTLACIPALCPACALIGGDRITGRDLAAAHPTFQAVSPEADLGPAPTVGTRRTFRNPELQRIAGEHGIEFEAASPRKVCFERSTISLGAEQLQRLLEVLVQSRIPDAAVEIVDFSRTRLPVGEVEFKLDGLAPTGFWRGRLRYGDNRSVPVWARVRITNTATGRSLTMPKTSPMPEVKRGESVVVEVVSGGVRLAFEGEAETSGNIGEAITVRSPANGQPVRAVVESKGKATIRK